MRKDNNVVELLGRLRKVMRIEEIAYRLDKSWATISSWESGRRNPDVANVEKLEKLAQERGV